MDVDFYTTDARLCAIFDLTCRVKNDKKELEFDVPGWSFDAFTRTGKLGLWNTCRMFEVARVLSKRYLSDEFSNIIYTEDGSTVLPVVRAQIGRFSRSLYKTATMALPMTGKLKLAQVGRSTFTLITELYHKKTMEVLGAIERLIVYKNMSTLTSEPVPEALDDWRKQNQNGPLKFEIELATRDALVGERAYEFRSRVVASDADLLYHVNQSVYYRYCMDAAYEAGKQDFLVNFPMDICEYEVQETQGKHTGECFIGDNFIVYVWEDHENLSKLHFQIDRAEECIFLSNIVFYPLLESRL